METPNLIYDLGLHRGEDTDLYPKKGFGVIGVEWVVMETALGQLRSLLGRTWLPNSSSSQQAAPFPLLRRGRTSDRPIS